MAEIRLSLEGDALREATMQAITGVLTPEMQAQMIQSAVEALLSPVQTFHSSRRETPIELAFREAVDMAVRKEAREMVENSAELRGHIAELLRLSIDKVIERDPDVIAGKIADAFLSQMYK